MRLGSFAGLALSTAVLAGCGGIRVSPSGVAAAARPAGCALEVLNQAPDRPYDELGKLDTHLTQTLRGGPREVLRDPACRLGADAVIVEKEFILNEYGHALVAGTAIRYRLVPPAPPTADKPSPAEKALPAEPPAPAPEKPEPPAKPETPRPPADPADTVKL